MSVNYLVLVAGVVAAVGGCSSGPAAAPAPSAAATGAAAAPSPSPSPGAGRSASPSPSQPACPWKPGGPRRPGVFGEFGGEVPLEVRCLRGERPGRGDLYRLPQQQAGVSGAAVVGSYGDGEVASVRCAVRNGAAVVDAGQNQSSVWLEVATTLLGFGRYAFVPHAAAGYTDLGSLQECPERDYRS